MAFLPCAIVYGALFYAMLSGSALRGGVVMAGFRLGAPPSVTDAALGVLGFRRLARAPNARVAVGLGTIALAVASIAVPTLALDGFCLP